MFHWLLLINGHTVMGCQRPGLSWICLDDNGNHFAVSEAQIADKRKIKPPGVRDNRAAADMPGFIRKARS